jgi:hypothetical protein
VADGQTSQATTANAQATGQSSSAQSTSQQDSGTSQTANGSSATTQSSQASGSQASGQTKAERPDYVPETHWDATSNAVKPEFGAYVKELVGFKATEDSRRLTLPQKVEEYDFALPKDFKPPEGIEFKLNPDDPLAGQARAFALKHGLSKEGFSELLALHAAGKIGSEQSIGAAKAAEVQKLGVNGPARKTAVDTFIASVPGVSADDAKTFSQFMFSATQVTVLEKVMAHMRSQGVGSFRPNPDAPQPSTISDADWNKMSYAAQKEYSAQHDQQRFNGKSAAA